MSWHCTQCLCTSDTYFSRYLNYIKPQKVHCAISSERFLTQTLFPLRDLPVELMI